MLEDKILTWRFNNGRKQVLREIYEKYKHQLVTLAAALLYNKTTAEDAVHDVFLKLIRSNGNLKIRGNLKSYLMTAVANTARNNNKSTAIRSVGQIENKALTVNASDPENSAIFGEEKERLLQALAQLPYEQREALLLKNYSGLKFKAIARSQNVSINTVQGRYRYGLEKLRSLMNGEMLAIENTENKKGKK
jgi:RNA polymerase sigma-70 factor (ECF subfamily)